MHTHCINNTAKHNVWIEWGEKLLTLSYTKKKWHYLYEGDNTHIGKTEKIEMYHEFALDPSKMSEKELSKKEANEDEEDLSISIIGITKDVD